MACKIPLESITISRLFSKYQVFIPCPWSSRQASALMGSPQPFSSSTEVSFLLSCVLRVSVFAFVVFCLQFCVNRWGHRGGSDALPIYTHWGLSPLFCRAGLIISYAVFSSVTSILVVHNADNGISTTVWEGGLCSLAVSNSLGLVFWLVCFRFSQSMLFFCSKCHLY